MKSIKLIVLFWMGSNLNAFCQHVHPALSMGISSPALNDDSNWLKPGLFVQGELGVDLSSRFSFKLHSGYLYYLPPSDNSELSSIRGGVDLAFQLDTMSKKWSVGMGWSKQQYFLRSGSDFVSGENSAGSKSQWGYHLISVFGYRTLNEHLTLGLRYNKFIHAFLHERTEDKFGTLEMSLSYRLNEVRLKPPSKPHKRITGFVDLSASKYVLNRYGENVGADFASTLVLGAKFRFAKHYFFMFDFGAIKQINRELSTNALSPYASLSVEVHQSLSTKVDFIMRFGKGLGLYEVRKEKDSRPQYVGDDYRDKGKDIFLALGVSLNRRIEFYTRLGMIKFYSESQNFSNNEWARRIYSPTFGVRVSMF
jgi:hypothetical protein